MVFGTVAVNDVAFTDVIFAQKMAKIHIKMATKGKRNQKGTRKMLLTRSNLMRLRVCYPSFSITLSKHCIQQGPALAATMIKDYNKLYHCVQRMIGNLIIHGIEFETVFILQ